jgi:hypothetical protein
VIGEASGIQVVVDDAARPTIPWDDVDNMELVADTYWMLYVYQFRIVVELLGKMNRMKDFLPKDDE